MPQRQMEKELKQALSLYRDFVSQDEAVLLSYVLTWQKMDHFAYEFFSKFGLTTAQFNVLKVLNDYPANKVPQQELSRILLVAKATMAGVINRMVKKGWIERREDPNNRRANDISITQDGIKVLDKIKGPYYKNMGKLFEGISTVQKQEFLKTLAQIRGNLLNHPKVTNV